MSWGEVELEPEVSDWFLGLSETDQARVRFREIRRATETMQRCVAEGHLAEDEEE